MFITKSRHIAVVSRFEAANEILKRELSLVQSYLDYERELHKEQVQDLRKLVFPTAVETPPLQALEVDSILDGSPKPVTLTEAEFTRIREGEREQDLILSGNYSEDLFG